MISRWENGHVEVTEPGYRRLFREIYGRSNEELGFPPEALNQSAEELRNRLIVARSIDATTLDLFQRQVSDLRSSDRRFGAVNGARILTPRRRMNADPLVAVDL